MESNQISRLTNCHNKKVEIKNFDVNISKCVDLH